MILVLVLEMLQRFLRLSQDLVLPCKQLGSKILALLLIHEGLFVGWLVAFVGWLIVFGSSQHYPELLPTRLPARVTLLAGRAYSGDPTAKQLGFTRKGRLAR